MEKKAEQMRTWFDGQIAAYTSRQKELLADDRPDEAAFEKIRANVYDIFRTVLSVGVQNSGGREEAAKAFFLEKLRQIPSAWMASYNQASQNHDGKKMYIEQLKMDTAQEIRLKFSEIWEEKYE